MSEQPTVCAVMLTRDRPALAAKAVECFRRQTYPNARLLILNGGSTSMGFSEYAGYTPGYIVELHRDLQRYTIGALRNLANEATQPLNAQILIHWDDDEWSHPNRITEQVALLQP